MTALENVVAGRIFSREIHFFTRQTDIAAAEKLLELVGIAHKANTLGCDLTLSEQRRLDLARALANQPRLLILDEVAAGFSPVAVKQAVELVRRVRQRGVTLFIIDHFLTLSLRVSDRLLALDQGEKVAEGSPQQVMRNRGVISAYLGVRSKDE
jgi:branched-chain amino acid transport system ATP-binding protein